jgi:hypothetical protein
MAGPQVPLHLETRVCLPTNKSVTDYRCDSIEDDKRVYEKSFRFADIDFFLTDLNTHTAWRVSGLFVLHLLSQIKVCEDFFIVSIAKNNLKRHLKTL